MALLDTTVFLDLQGRGGRKIRSAAEGMIAQLLAGGERLSTSRVNVAELYVGVELSRDPVAEELAVQTSLFGMRVLEFDADAARDFARLRADLQRRGRLIGDMDMLIAAIALANAEPVVTRNPAHFADIPGLQVIPYG